MEAKRLVAQKEDEKEGPGESEAEGSTPYESRTWLDVVQLWPELTAPELWVQACSPSLGRGPSHLGSKSRAAEEGP